MFHLRRLRARSPRTGLESDLAALADGALDAGAAERLRRRVQDDDPLRRELAQQESVARALRNSQVGAPPELQRRVGAMALQASLRAPSGQAIPLGGAVLGLTATAAALAAALLLALSGAPDPTIAQAAALGLRPATGPAPREGGDGRHLAAAVQGLAFPDWSPGWRPAGVRADRIGGRLARTIVYVDPAGRRVGYTIVSGAPLSAARAGLHTIAGVSYGAAERAGVVSVSWRQGGHTCVLVSRAVHAGALIGLAGGEQQPSPAYSR
jgi:hypothetical protein